MVVGHNPSMSQFLSQLVTGGASEWAIEMKKGSVAQVDSGPQAQHAELVDHAASGEERLHFGTSQLAAKDLGEVIPFPS